MNASGKTGKTARVPWGLRSYTPALAIAVLMAGAWLALSLARSVPAQNYPKAEIVIHGQTIVVDVADTPDLQVRGLSGRRHLAADEGMIFVYADAAERVFWMRDMHIPIDMIWLNNNHVVHIEPSVPPPSEGTAVRDLPTYRAGRPANLVLELAAGRSAELGLKVGDRVQLKFH